MMEVEWLIIPSQLNPRKLTAKCLLHGLVLMQKNMVPTLMAEKRMKTRDWGSEI